MGKIRGAFYSDAQGFGQLEAGARQLHQPKTFTAAMDLGISILFTSACRVALRNLGLSC